ncbi:MAG: response regulator transcription factor [Chloroflexi bacterium]|nr:response regulator transcription factor [Chloroflexota bacterium]
MEDVAYSKVLTAIVQRFVRLVGVPAALNIARRVPNLKVDSDGNVVDYDRANPLATVVLLIDQYGTVFGDVADTLAQQATQSLRPLPLRAPLPPKTDGAASSRPITLLIVDDHILFREGLASLLSSQPDFQIVGQSATLEDAVSLSCALRPNVLLLDFDLPADDGADATRAILDESPETQIVFLGVHEDTNRLFQAIQAGAVGFLYKTVRSAELFGTVRGVTRGEAGISRTIARRLLQEFSQSPVLAYDNLTSDDSKQLTAREIEILRELARGASNREIAKRLVISENTVKNHVRNVLVKLHLHSRRDVAGYVRRNGIQPWRSSKRSAN